MYHSLKDRCPFQAEFTVYNASLDLDCALVQVILTDSIFWRFFYFDISKMEVYRGETGVNCGFRRCTEPFWMVAPLDRAEKFLVYLKLGN
jgi:hypothetical protein